MRCLVCRGISVHHFLSVDPRVYWRCNACKATFLDPHQRLSAADEHAHYLHHQNTPDDPSYRRFLAKLSVPLIERLDAGMKGLDFGCGPGPALAAVLSEAGHNMALYDPFFYPDRIAMEQTYDFIACTETVEHFFDPAGEFDRFDTMLRPGGWLAVMTCFQTEDDRFAEWHYRKDPTHVVFYRTETFSVLAEQRGWTFECPAKDVALMRKGACL